jgi:4-hydroxybenzoate polyprenyltransferase
LPRSTFARLILLARPRGAALITSLPIVGFGYAHWERGSTASPLVVVAPLTFLIASWLFGHAGAMWLNADLDRDQGPVLFGRPVAVPAGVVPAGYLALAASVALAAPLGAIVLTCALCCAILAVLYSHRRVALKGSAIGGPLVNGLGYGSLSPLAGFAAASGIPTWRALVTLGFAVLFILGTYFAAQAFQGDEDRRRGYRTMVLTHGAAWTLAVAHACLRAAVIGAMLAALAGVYPRVFVATLPAWLLADRHLARWRLTPAADHAAGLVKRLAIGVVLVVGAAYLDHIWLLMSGLAGGGCATAIIPDAIATVCAP